MVPLTSEENMHIPSIQLPIDEEERWARQIDSSLITTRIAQVQQLCGQ